MAYDYDTIRQDNERRYGTDIGRIGRMLLADRYADRTHFIYELLQNAEDALARRSDWQGSRAVSFGLGRDSLRVSHFGIPFDEGDIRGVCGIGESTKDLTAIGRFGIGFKSVYAFSDRPEVHSGSEAFAIESFVWPVAVDPVERDMDETVILIPLQEGDDAGKAEIAAGLSRLGASSLLFLQEIDEISWSVDGTPVGVYLREATREGPGVRRVNVVGKEQGEPEVDDEWLVFSRPVHTEDGKVGGEVELAWLTGEDENGCRTLRTVQQSPLVVFFPTVVETRLGFLLQGPYRTTPSRDNVPPRDEWNRTCVRETGALLIESLRWLRDQGLLDATALTCLPTDPARFKGSMFRELLDDTKRALKQEELLPVLGSTYARALDICLARSEELRKLLSSTQLAALLGHPRPLQWLDRTISRDRTPELRRYLVWQLGIREFTPETFLSRLTAGFLKKQTDEWIQDLYKFLGSQRALRPRMVSRPIIRLEDGSHVVPAVDGDPQAFLPGAAKTSFPTVRDAVCRTEEAREFLESLKLTEPDPVDDIIRNVLPKYREAEVMHSETEYSSDVALMLDAAATDSRGQRDRLVTRLREAPWVRAVDGVGRREQWAKPGDVYLATGRLRRLFEGVGEVLLVDSRVDCLKGKEVRELLERSGASRYLQTSPVRCDLTREAKTSIRQRAGLERSTWSKEITDQTIRGLDALFDKLETLEAAARASRAHDLWDALVDLNKRRGSRPFQVVYTWGYFRESKTALIDAAFLRTLDKRRWVPDSLGNLRLPGSVAFEELGWEPNAFLQSKILFEPPLLAQLAEAAGIERGVLDLLQQLGVTSEAKLRERLGVKNQEPNRSGRTKDDDGPPDDQGQRPESAAEDKQAASGDGSESNKPVSEKRSTDSATSRSFISYVAVVPEGEDTDPDGLEHSDRMELERLAIEIVLKAEQDWQLTPPNNPGFDLYRGATMETATEWCEVKAMTGTLDDHPVGISRTQFEWAETHRTEYWLYVVERTRTSDAKVVRIRDPVGKAETFTFDRGWRGVAE
ncbi:MAG: DUF3883 domain-containing protein [bacterium]|nr:DUF3883 domain-containing protein [bacterium]